MIQIGVLEFAIGFALECIIMILIYFFNSLIDCVKLRNCNISMYVNLLIDTDRGDVGVRF